MQLSQTARAFDIHALDYDRAVESNPLLQSMRAALWQAVERWAQPPSRVLDLGCGTGIDAAHFAALGYRVTALDPSREMVAQTQARAARAALTDCIRVENLGAEQLDRVPDTFDLIYSDLGPLNCVAELHTVAQNCARLLKPDGKLIVSVMSRYCLWEILYYTLRGEWAQATRRHSDQPVFVNLRGVQVPTRYYSPREFIRAFADSFDLVSYRALNLFLPPPYLYRAHSGTSAVLRPLARLDVYTNALPLLRDFGDHFLMTLAPITHSKVTPPLMGEGQGVRSSDASGRAKGERLK